MAPLSRSTIRMAPLSQLGLLAGLAAVLCSSPAATLSAPKIHARVLKDGEAVNESYDYVVIGGGTAGLTVGDRLTEDGKGKPVPTRNLDLPTLRD
jgi:hypothetical protein